eukprot:m.272967 g.272967  ORF g.272967 m.272967 type:complete len:125 (+) comp19335_c0_seq7:2563-2937(+)
MLTPGCDQQVYVNTSKATPTRARISLVQNCRPQPTSRHSVTTTMTIFVIFCCDHQCCGCRPPLSRRVSNSNSSSNQRHPTTRTLSLSLIAWGRVAVVCLQGLEVGFCCVPFRVTWGIGVLVCWW